MSIKNIYWSRNVGQFVNQETGEIISRPDLVPANLSLQEWYETLGQIIRLESREFPTILTSLDVNTILENCSQYRPVYNTKDMLEDVFLGPAKRYGEIHGREIWIDAQMDSHILHLFYNKDTFDRDRVSIHVVGLDFY